MKNIFINPTTSLIRSGWTIAIFIVLFMVINMTLMFTTRAILGSLPAKGTIWFLILGVSATIALFLTSKYITKSSLASLGLQWRYAFKDLFAGVLISALIMSIMYFLLLQLGYVQFNGFSWWNSEIHQLGEFDSSSIWMMLAVLFQFIVVAWWEELAFRGIILQNIARGLNIKWGIIISTVGFGLIHVGNPNASILSFVIIMLITFKLVFAYLKTGQLWMPIGLHLGWNFFQASVFGFASSGHKSASLISQSPLGPDWLSGGEFGAENSIFILPITLASLYLMHLWVKYSRNLKSLALKDFLVSNDQFQNPSKT